MTEQVWGYKLDADGQIEGKLFDGEKLPKGWKDTPASLKPKAKANDNGA